MARRANPKHSFEGLLAEPVIRAAGVLMAIPEIAEAERDRVIAALNEKFELLAKHYGIDAPEPGRYFALALALATEFVPGFKIVSEPTKGRGRSRKWTSSTYTELLADVEKLKRDCPDDQRKAIRRYLNNTGVKRPTESQIESIEARLSEARNPERNSMARFLSGPPGRREYMLNSLIEHFSTAYGKWDENSRR